MESTGGILGVHEECLTGYAERNELSPTGAKKKDRDTR